MVGPTIQDVGSTLQVINAFDIAISRFKAPQHTHQLNKAKNENEQK
jgi:hypothetical protein